MLPLRVNRQRHTQLAQEGLAKRGTVFGRHDYSRAALADGINVPSGCIGNGRKLLCVGFDGHHTVTLWITWPLTDWKDVMIRCSTGHSRFFAVRHDPQKPQIRCHPVRINCLLNTLSSLPMRVQGLGGRIADDHEQNIRMDFRNPGSTSATNSRIPLRSVSKPTDRNTGRYTDLCSIHDLATDCASDSCDGISTPGCEIAIREYGTPARSA